MGRIIRHEAIGFRCELRSCYTEVDATRPTPATASWPEQLEQLARIVAAGWAVTLTPQLRSYCPVHADRVWQCTCRRHPERTHLCTVHNPDIAALAWTQDTIPSPVTRLKEHTP